MAKKKKSFGTSKSVKTGIVDTLTRVLIGAAAILVNRFGKNQVASLVKISPQYRGPVGVGTGVGLAIASRSFIPGKHKAIVANGFESAASEQLATTLMPYLGAKAIVALSDSVGELPYYSAPELPNDAGHGISFGESSPGLPVAAASV